MFEIYYVDGQAYEVSPSRLEEFLQRFPNAVRQQSADFTVAEAPSAVEKSSNWFTQALKAGAINADLYDDADAVFDIGNAEEARQLSDQELFTYIDLVKRSQQSAGEMQELAKWSSAFSKYSNQGENWLMSAWMATKEEGAKGLAQSVVQSYTSMGSGQLLGEAVAPTVTAAAGGAAATAYGYGFGALPAGAAAFFTSMNYGLETINTFNQLLQEEIDNAGMDFTPDAIRSIMSNDDIRARIKKKARTRGLTIGGIEGVTSMVGIKGAGAVSKSINATSKVGKVASNIAATTVASTAEAVGGGAGEFFAEKAIGREASGLDIMLEGLAPGIAKGPIDVVIAGIQPAVQSTGAYYIDNKKVKKAALMDYLNENVNTAEDIATLLLKLKLKIK